ncbi:hypothetical protein [Hymenobacter lapidiphilus]|uniref:Uncharacterized protein n=1 Tax=Hymenobacter lapidiphilus TaxID=2608003 RepID=A0A7Y7PM86_9BACT|nr:hypothetical protein [Hymenobacter lapidiphilus]NVO30416.1 hypothetical protein [Hymenobacter lapidiphilus]
MNDPTDLSARSLHTIDSGHLEIYASSATWLKIVDFYKSLLAPSSKQAGPAVAIFQMAGGNELYIILTNDQALLAKQAGHIPWHLPLDNAGQVAQAMQRARSLGADVVLDTTYAWAFPIPVHLGGQAIITLGTVRFQTHPQLSSDDTTLGLIHNPNW